MIESLNYFRSKKFHSVGSVLCPFELRTTVFSFVDQGEALRTPDRKSQTQEKALELDSERKSMLGR